MEEGFSFQTLNSQPQTPNSELTLMPSQSKSFSILNLVLTTLGLITLTSGCSLLEEVGELEFVKSAQEEYQIATSDPSQPGYKKLYQIPDDWSTIEQQIIIEHNRVREDPQSYIPLMEAWLEQFENEFIVRDGVAPRVNLITHEGKSAVREAIEFLRNQPPVQPLEPSVGLAKAASDHVQDQSLTGETGHDGADGSEPQDRMKRYGLPYLSGENIAYGPNTAQQVVMQLIIDDNVPDRGHRTNIFKPEFQVAGVSCGQHLTFRTMCVINYAQGFLEDANAQVPDITFKVSNRSGVDVTEIYLTATSKIDWGDNRLSEPLSDRYIGTFTSSSLIQGDSQVCNNNLRAVLATGEDRQAEDINLCDQVYTLDIP